MQIHPENIRRAFQEFDWKTLFLEELLWNKPRAVQPPKIEEATAREVAHLGQIPVYEITTDGPIPEGDKRREIHGQIAKTTVNCLLIFVDETRAQTLWLWAKREKNRFAYRENVWVRGQSSDLFLAKLAALFVDIEDSASEGGVSALRGGKILANALDTSKVTTKFYNQWKEIQLEIAPLIEGLPDEKTRAQYTLVLLHRLMFIYFLQKRGFVDNDVRYLENKSESYGDGSFFQNFLKPLFFEGFAQPEGERSAATKTKIGDVKYLNGGLFLPHPLEREFPAINAPDVVFEKILRVFGGYDWFADDSRDNSRGLLSPELLGFIFEKFINDQKSAGAYYTPEALTSYLCQRAIEDLILDEVKIYAGSHARRADSVFDLIGHADKNLCGAIWERLKDLRVLDPAVGSGAFLVAAFYTLSDIYVQLYGRAASLGLKPLLQQMMGDEAKHASPFYAMHRRIITHNLYGVDLMEGAPEIARLRLFLALVSSARTRDELEPLPNIDFNILEGNSLIGMMSCDDKDFVGGGLWVQKDFEELRNQKSNRINLYKNADESMRPQLAQLRIEANEMRDQLRVICNEATVAHWNALGIKRVGHNKVKIGVRAADIEQLRPFHWGAEFPEAMEAGGFDAILTNPPWEVFKPNGKEFLQLFSKTITKKTMSIKEFETEKDRLIADPQIKAKWDEYQASFPYVSEYFRRSPSYRNQISVVGGKKAGTDINLYKLFVERCFDLLQPNGRCGIVIPSGIYTDLGTKGLREMLFEKTQVTSLFGVSNEKFIFEGVDHRVKFCALTWAKGGKTKKFPAAFRINPREAVRDKDLPDLFYNKENQVEIEARLVRELSPDNLSIMEFRGEADLNIVKKMLKFPSLGERIEETWNLKLTREFDMTNDSDLFQLKEGEGLVSLYQGGMIHHFNANYGSETYWVNEKEARLRALGRKQVDTGQKLEYQTARFGFRAIARNSDSRTIIVGPIPPNVFCGNSLLVNSAPAVGRSLTGPEMLYFQAVANSMTLDYLMRMMVSANINMFYLYQLPAPRLTSGDAEFDAIVSASARLICTTAEFDALAREAGLSGHAQGAATPDERAALRAQLDARIARLYGLNEGEFAHILATFPLVDEPTKLAARNAFRDLERGVVS